MSSAESRQPYDLEAERQVLGILLKHPETMEQAVDNLRSGHFYDPFHRQVFEIMHQAYHAKGRVSYTMVYSQLRREGTVENPAELLMALTESFATALELDPAIELLLRFERIRRLLEAVDTARDVILRHEEEDMDAVCARVQEILFAATQDNAGEAEIKSLLEILNKCYVNLMERKRGSNDVYGLSVRYPSIDAMTTGFKKRDLLILAARPSMGKTALAMNMAVNVARRDIPVLVFSLEMDDEQIGDRIVVSELFRYQEGGEFAITANEYQTRLSDEQFAQAQQVFNELYPLPITVVDQRGLTCADIRAKARKVKAQTPELGLLVIDYLQLIKPPLYGGQRSWTLIVGEIVRELRDLAGELNVPIMLLSQLNRGVESRDNKRPLMSDLRDSGNIEEFADVVMFLYREDYYAPEQAQQNGTEGLVEVIFAKQRKGPTGTIHLRFVKEYTRFIDEFKG